jgi:protein-S-isoprenylcysteine O-methyltransferase Ste14
MGRFLVPLLLGVFFVVALVFPMVRHQRRTGQTALMLAGSREWKTVAGFLAAVVVGGGWTLAYLVGGPAAVGVKPPTALQGLAGTIVGIAGTGIVVTAQAQMGLSWRIGIDDRPTELVATGLYRHVRNPIYSGLCLLLAGIVVLAPTAYTVLAWVAAAAAIAWQARSEERHLLATHGDAWRAYAAQVGRFIPGIGRLQ